MTNAKSNLEALVNRVVREDRQSLVRWATTRFGEWVAEDAVQFAISQLAFGKMPPDHPAPIRWLKRVAKNEALKLMEVHRENRPSFVSLDEIGVLASSVDDPAQAAEDAEVIAIFDQLTDDQRLALRLSIVDGLTYVEIAEELGWTYTKVNRSITEGRAKARKLRREGEGGES